MNRRQWMLLGLGLALMAGTVVALIQFKARQRLGEPGLKYTPIPGDLRVNLEFPTNVPGFSVQFREADEVTRNALPPDTSIVMANYRDPAGRDIQVTAVLMGTDRTSIHKPQFCLPGQGWTIDDSRSSAEMVSLDQPEPGDLPVMRVVSTRTIEVNGQPVPLSSIYVYWFVAHDALTEDHARRVWWMAKHLLQTGELQRWAYVSYFTTCLPGEEDAAFHRVKQLIRLTVPQFQTARPPSRNPGALQQTGG